MLFSTMKPIKFLYIIALLAALSSCQKVINVNLNSASPRIVIEGNIVNNQAVNIIRITKTVDFNQDNVFPTVSGALVLVTDNTAQVIDTLVESTPGTYSTSKIIGTPGHTYTMYIKVDSSVFTAASTMPTFVTLDSLYDTKFSFGNEYTLTPVYTDPVETGNNYLFIEFINGVQADDIFLANDRLINGMVMTSTLNAGARPTKVLLGDNIQLYMYCIDSAVYNYFYTLRQTKNQNSATPANPISNIKGGALGYFSAHTSDTKSIVVQ